MKKLILSAAATLFMSSLAIAQFRAQDQTGINVFETPKTETGFDGVKVTIGGAFTQGWQSLSHSNTATSFMVANPALTNASVIPTYDKNLLVSMKPGFNSAVANLNFNVALADGVDLKMELYLSARHHQETWVKGGYIQFNKLPFLKMDFVNDIMKFTTIKVGHMEINYGDAHFRRSDNGNAIYNPFIENYIMDAFATEIGAEIDFTRNGFVGVVGMTTGQIKADVSAPTPGYFITSVDGVKKDTTMISDGTRKPALLAKVGWDGNVIENLRVRATASGYYTAGSTGVTLYGGDRGGSHYYGAMDNTLSGATGTKENIAFTTGRYNPGFGDKITSVMGNLLLDYKFNDKFSVESFTTYEKSKGRGKAEGTGERNATQIAEDLVLRYGDFYIGARYNKVDADVAAVYNMAKAAVAASTTYSLDTKTGLVVPKTTAATVLVAESTTPGYSVAIDRIAVSAGYFFTKNVMAKVEYTTQNYNGFPTTDIRSGGKFKGLVLEAVVGF